MIEYIIQLIPNSRHFLACVSCNIIHNAVNNTKKTIYKKSSISFTESIPMNMVVSLSEQYVFKMHKTRKRSSRFLNKTYRSRPKGGSGLGGGRFPKAFARFSKPYKITFVLANTQVTCG